MNYALFSLEPPNSSKFFWFWTMMYIKRLSYEILIIANADMNIQGIEILRTANIDGSFQLKKIRLPEKDFFCSYAKLSDFGLD